MYCPPQTGGAQQLIHFACRRALGAPLLSIPHPQPLSLQEVLNSWFLLGRLGGFNSGNLQARETNYNKHLALVFRYYTIVCCETHM